MPTTRCLQRAGAGTLVLTTALGISLTEVPQAITAYPTSRLSSLVQAASRCVLASWSCVCGGWLSVVGVRAWLRAACARVRAGVVVWLVGCVCVWVRVRVREHFTCVLTEVQSLSDQALSASV